MYETSVVAKIFACAICRPGKVSRGMLAGVGLLPRNRMALLDVSRAGAPGAYHVARFYMKYNELIVRAYFRDCKLPPAETEYRFKLDRRWRFDWAWPDKKIALEVDGGIWIRGGHNRGAQMLKTWEKENAAASIGWRILRCQPQDLCTLELVELLRKALSC